MTATALIRPIKSKFPDALIYFLAKPGAVDLLNEIPDVSGVIADTQSYSATPNDPEFDMVLNQVRAESFDILINLWEHPRYALLGKKAGIPMRIGHAIGIQNRLYHTHLAHLNYQDYQRHKVQMNLALLAPLGISDMQSPMMLTLSNATQKAARAEFPFMNHPYRICHVDAGALVKCLTDDEIRPVLAGLIGEDPSPIVLLGGRIANAGEASITWINAQPQLINLVGKTTLIQTAALIKDCLYFVGPDSGLSHMAAAFQRPALVLYRNRTQNVLHWGPWQSPHRIYKQQNKCPDSCNPSTCTTTGCREPFDPVKFVTLTRQLDHSTGDWEKMGYQAGFFCDDAAFSTIQPTVPSEWRPVRLDKTAWISDIKNQIVANNLNLLFCEGTPSLKLRLAAIWASNFIHFLPIFRPLDPESSGFPK